MYIVHCTVCWVVECMYVLYINSVESTHTVDGKSMGEIKEKKYKNVRKINYYSFFSWLLKQFGFNSRFCKHQNTTRVGKLVLKKTYYYVDSRICLLRWQFMVLNLDKTSILLHLNITINSNYTLNHTKYDASILLLLMYSYCILLHCLVLKALLKPDRI